MLSLLRSARTSACLAALVLAARLAVHLQSCELRHA
jgi:hypothetical protein